MAELVDVLVALTVLTALVALIASTALIAIIAEVIAVEATTAEAVIAAEAIIAVAVIVVVAEDTGAAVDRFRIEMKNPLRNGLEKSPAILYGLFSITFNIWDKMKYIE